MNFDDLDAKMRVYEKSIDQCILCHSGLKPIRF